MKFPLTKKDLPGFEISEPILRDVFPGCYWWSVTKGFMRLSIYYDPSDMLGFVGKPYFEIYDFTETYRFMEDDTYGMKECILSIYNDVEKEVDEYPENFL